MANLPQLSVLCDLRADGGSSPSGRGVELAAEKIAGEMAQGNPCLPGAGFQRLDDIGLDGYFVMAVTQVRHHSHRAEDSRVVGSVVPSPELRCFLKAGEMGRYGINSLLFCSS